MVSKKTALREAKKIRGRGKKAKVIFEPRLGAFMIQTSKRRKRKK